MKKSEQIRVWVTGLGYVPPIAPTKVPTAIRNEAAKLFGASRQTVYCALRYPEGAKSGRPTSVSRGKRRKRLDTSDVLAYMRAYAAYSTRRRHLDLYEIIDAIECGLVDSNPPRAMNGDLLRPET